MKTILCDISALQYYRTPPWVTGNIVTPADSPNDFFPAASHRNASPASVALSHHLCGSLAGVSPPFHILDADGKQIRTRNITCHRGQAPSAQDILPLGEGLYVTSPTRTLLDIARRYGDIAAAKVMCEFCGLYTIVNMTDRLESALERIPQPEAHGYRTQLSAYYDQNGSTLSFAKQEDQGALWESCIQRNKKASNLWKRPPLCTIDELVGYASTAGGAYGIQKFRRALRLAVPGSGSPAETIAALLMGPERRLGQEGLPAFLMNRRVFLDEIGALSLEQRSCVLDISWPDGSKVREGCCVEIDGAAFHDDSLIDPSKLRSVNKDSARRAALAHMGIEVVSLAWSQLIGLGRWDIAMDLVYEKLGIERPVPSVAFLKKRNKLREKVFAPDIGLMTSKHTKHN